jgi:acetyl esterase/lipase
MRMNFRTRSLVSGWVSGLVLILALGISLSAAPHACGQQAVLTLWPTGTPEPPQTTAPEADVTKPTDNFINGHRSSRITNVTKPTLSVYPPHGHNTGAAALVFPGGGYSILAWTGEGTDTCEWLNSVGLTCLLVKYRVPQPPGEAGHYPADPQDLEDAQQAMRLSRAHAQEWHIEPDRIGVVGFSAGANLAVLLCTHPDDTHVESTPAASEVDASLKARPNFAIIVYPAYLAVPPAMAQLFPAYAPDRYTPATFLIQAENDRHYGKNALVYYRALMDANVPAQLHYYATGGHGFGVHPVGKPEEHWTDLADAWLRDIHVLPPDEAGSESTGAGPGVGAPSSPCPTAAQQQQQQSQSQAQGNHADSAQQSNPNCWPQ